MKTTKPVATASVRTSLLLLFLVAAALRLALIPPPQFPPRGDQAEYLALARSLAMHGTFTYADGRPTAFRAPLYPFALSRILRFHGESPRAIHLFHVALGSLVPPLLLLLLLESGIPRRAALPAALLSCAFGLATCGELLTENLHVPLLLLSLLFAARALRAPGSAASLRAGALAGLAALARPVSLVLLPAFLFAARSRGKGVAFTLAALLAVTPWAVRNSLALGRATLLDANAGYNLFVGHDPAVDRPPDFAASGRAALALAPDLLFDDRPLFAAALARIAADPFRAIARVPWKIARLFGGGIPELRAGAARTGGSAALFAGWLLAYAPAALATLLFFAALPFLSPEEPFDRLALATVALTVAVHAVLFGMPRFREPLLPVMLALAARASASPSGARQNAARRRAALLLILGLFAGWLWEACAPVL